MYSLDGLSHWVSDVCCVRAINQAAVSHSLELCFYEWSFSFYEAVFFSFGYNTSQPVRQPTRRHQDAEVVVCLQIQHIHKRYCIKFLLSLHLSAETCIRTVWIFRCWKKPMGPFCESYFFSSARLRVQEVHSVIVIIHSF